MEEWISILQTYSEVLTVASIVMVGLILAISLSRILRQIKRLNRSLTSITKNIQAYFDVIMQEEAQVQEETTVQDAQKQYTQEDVQGECAKAGQDEKELENRRQEEEVFNAVLQEYFS